MTPVNTHPGYFWHLIAKFFLKIIRNNNVANKFVNLGQLANYRLILKSTFNISSRELNQRSKFDRLKMFSELFQLHSGNIVIYEFGVANGHLANWMLEKHGKDFVKYYGFDLFTGLPRAWRNLKSGHFSNDGQIPDFGDSRMTFIKGDVTETFDPIILTQNSNFKSLIILDLDLYEPTLDILNKMLPLLKTGDYVYFDEAYDHDELQIWSNYLQEKITDVRFEFEATTPTSLLIRVS